MKRLLPLLPSKIRKNYIYSGKLNLFPHFAVLAPAPAEGDAQWPRPGLSADTSRQGESEEWEEWESGEECRS